MPDVVGQRCSGCRGNDQRSRTDSTPDNLLNRAGGDDATAADHQELVGGLRHLAHQV